MPENFDDLVTLFVASRKEPLRRPRWRTTNHSDYAAFSMPVMVVGAPHLRGRVIVTAHRLRMPPKICFTLLFRGRRVFALDVNPARFHRNLLSRESVGVTHWQRWPTMEAEADDRQQPFQVWLYEFLRRANVLRKFAISSPPRGKQLDLLDG